MLPTLRHRFGAVEPDGFLIRLKELLVIMSMLVSCCVPSADAHGYLSQPVSRNYYANLQQTFWNRKFEDLH